MIFFEKVEEFRLVSPVRIFLREHCSGKLFCRELLRSVEVPVNAITRWSRPPGGEAYLLYWAGTDGAPEKFPQVVFY